MREQIHHETVNPAEWLSCSDGLLPCFRDNETGIRNGPAFFQQARRAPLHGSPMQPACQTAGSPTGRPPRHPQQRSPTSRPPANGDAAPPHNNPRRSAAQYPARPDKRRTARQRDANPLHSNPRRPVTKWRANRHGSHPPEPPPPAPSCIKPPGHQRAPPSPSGKSAYQFPRLAPPSPLWETRTTPPARAAEHARPLHPFCGGSTRRAPLRRGKRGCGGAENILFLIPEYPLTTA